jgi:hypothetical protein
MKNIKFILFALLFVFVLSVAKSDAYPRHRLYRPCGIRPGFVVKKYVYAHPRPVVKVIYPQRHKHHVKKIIIVR